MPRAALVEGQGAVDSLGRGQGVCVCVRQGVGGPSRQDRAGGVPPAPRLAHTTASSITSTSTVSEGLSLLTPLELPKSP